MFARARRSGDLVPNKRMKGTLTRYQHPPASTRYSVVPVCKLTHTPHRCRIAPTEATSEEKNHILAASDASDGIARLWEHPFQGRPRVNPTVKRGKEENTHLLRRHRPSPGRIQDPLYTCIV